MSPPATGGWDPAGFWEKAKEFAERAQADRGSDQSSFWLLLTIEPLIRWSLATISPTLLVDTSRDHGENGLLYALGMDVGRPPRSADISVLVGRLHRARPLQFTEEDADFIRRSILRWRNEMLHGPVGVFKELKGTAWLPRYYRSCGALLTIHGQSLAHLFGQSEGFAAQDMVAALDKQIKDAVDNQIKAFKAKYEQWDATARAELVAKSPDFSKNLPMQFLPDRVVSCEKCPACGEEGLLRGEVFQRSAPKVVDDRIEVTRSAIPTYFQCYVCGLVLVGASQVMAAGSFGPMERIETYKVGEYTPPMYPETYPSMQPEDEFEDEGYSFWGPV